MPVVVVLFLCSLVFAQETSVARYARAERGMLAKEYDMEGGRAYWVDGVSVLGLPDFSAALIGFGEPARRLPFGLAGFYVSDFVYERYGLSLNGANGALRIKNNYALLDTPVTELLWERYGLEGNALRLDFSRLAVDAVGISLGVSAHSSAYSGEFRYQEIINQLYLNTLKRDSSRVPLTGRNLQYGSLHIVPTVSWHTPRSTLSLKASVLFLENDDATRDIPEKEAPYTSIIFPREPYNLDMNAYYFGLAWNFRPAPDWELSIEHRIANQSLKFSGLDTNYVYYSKDAMEEKWSGQSGEGMFTHKTALNPHIRWDYEIMEKKDSLSPAQNRELLAFGLRDSLWRIQFNGETALQRNSSATGEKHIKPVFFVDATLALPFNLYFTAAHQMDYRYPDIAETHLSRAGRITFANDSLKPEKKERSDARLMYRLSKHFYYEAGYRYEQAADLIVPRWAAQKDSPMKSMPADSAYAWTNMSSIYNNELFWSAGVELGNWRLFAEHGKSFLRSNISFIPSRYYKGGVYWSNRFVEDRLKVSVQLDADWFGSRYDYGLRDDTTAVPVQLGNYLSLNFKSQMQIQDFILYARIENMNHSLMETEVGYAPPGIRFAYGIQWRLDD